VGGDFGLREFLSVFLLRARGKRSAMITAGIEEGGGQRAEFFFLFRGAGARGTTTAKKVAFLFPSLSRARALNFVFPRL